MVQTLCTSVEAYRQVESGIVSSGEKGLKSNIGKCMDYLKVGLEFAAKIPLVNAFA